MSSLNKPLKHLNQIAKKPKLDVEFQDLKYFVRDSNAKNGRVQILNGINGKFRCGKLTAILGPSGAGKTTLLNILAGYVTEGIEGEIKINSHPRNLKIFNKLSAFIMQEDFVQPRLTSKEAVIYAARLKLGPCIKYQDKEAVAGEVLNFLGLENCVNTFCENLSGGEKKRLAVALELVNNPPVIFLDEPTTGLDNYSIKQCIDLLKKISGMPRTVVCTIHQPPASLFQIFDQVYILANGFCVYNGPPSQLVPFFTIAGHSCPSNSTPAEYMIELVHSSPHIISSLKTKIENGKIDFQEVAEVDWNASETDNNEEIFANCVQNTVSSTFYIEQMWILLARMSLQASRSRIILLIQIIQHLISGLCIGGTFAEIEKNSGQIFTMGKFCICCALYTAYTYVMTTVLLLPFEMELIKREFFNQWYSLKAYYTAWTFINVPLLIIFCTIFTTLVYLISGQPHEVNRFIGFSLISVALGLTSQGLGFILGAVLSAKNGAIVASALIIVFLNMATYAVGYQSTVEPFVDLLMSLSFMRSGFFGLCSALYYQREPFVCNEDEFDCPYTHGDIMLNKMSVPVTDYRYYLIYIFGFMMIFRISGYLVLKCRLNIGLTSRIEYYFKKLVNVHLKCVLCFREGLFCKEVA